VGVDVLSTSEEPTKEGDLVSVGGTGIDGDIGDSRPNGCLQQGWRRHRHAGGQCLEAGVLPAQLVDGGQGRLKPGLEVVARRGAAIGLLAELHWAHRIAMSEPAFASAAWYQDLEGVLKDDADH
jgi:hypothetical protein